MTAVPKLVSKPVQQLTDLAETGWGYFSRIRLKALLWTVGIAGMTFAAIALTSVAWVPVVGVAAAAVVVSIHNITVKLKTPVCWECGSDLKGEPAHAYGIRCPGCGTLNEPVRAAPRDEEIAAMAARASEGDDEQPPTPNGSTQA